MSKLSDYSKFDSLKDDDDDDSINESSTAASQQQTQQQQPPTPPPTSSVPPSGSLHQDPKNPDRYYFEYNNQRIYDFQQDLDQMTIYVKPPPNISKGSQIKCEITPSHLKLGLVGATQWYLNEDTFGLVDVDESTWSLEDDESNRDEKSICIYLTKANRGKLWDAALKGNSEIKLNEFHKEQVKKELMLQRFQEENPGFDFRGAEFNGSVPDAREFMGGVKYH
jgi:hypothetical protein